MHTLAHQLELPFFPSSPLLLLLFGLSTFTVWSVVLVVDTHNYFVSLALISLNRKIKNLMCTRGEATLWSKFNFNFDNMLMRAGCIQANGENKQIKLTHWDTLSYAIACCEYNDHFLCLLDSNLTRHGLDASTRKDRIEWNDKQRTRKLNFLI